MISVAREPGKWNARRWLLWSILFFGAQLLFIYFLSLPRSTTAPLSAATRANIRLVTKPVTELEFSRSFWASDPTLFAMANPHGFSGHGWLKIPTRHYDVAKREESPFWLPLETAQLGSGVAQFMRTNAIASFATSRSVSPGIFSSSMEFPDDAPSNSQLRVEGELAARKLIDYPQLQTWATNGILSNSVVEVSVDRTGVVISSRLMSQSDAPDADRAALSLARELRFEPTENPAASWGKIVFDWHTAPPPITNSPSVNQK